MRFLFFLLLPLIACSSSNPQWMTEEIKESQKCTQIAGRIRTIFIEKMLKEKHLVAVGTGSNGIDKLECLSVTFQTFRKYDTQQARELLVDCVEQFKTIINQHEEIEQYSRDFPYTDKNIDIDVLFLDENKMFERGRFVSPPYIAVAAAKEGKLTYCIDLNDCLKRIYEETYEEALAALNRKSFASIPLLLTSKDSAD